MPDSLLIVGVAATVVSLAVLLIEGALRPGYHSTYHTVSALSLGDRGWIQIANFLQLGAGMFAFAVAVHWTLNSVVGAVLLAIFGLRSIVAGVAARATMRALRLHPARWSSTTARHMESIQLIPDDQ